MAKLGSQSDCHLEPMELLVFPPASCQFNEQFHHFPWQLQACNKALRTAPYALLHSELHHSHCLADCELMRLYPVPNVFDLVLLHDDPFVHS
jgi:hypothetical protein